MTDFTQTGLLLLGHGSHFNPDSSAPIHAHAGRVRMADSFLEVRTGFWKEEPAICRSLELFDAEQVVVVPVFMSGGYFTEEIIPRELGISGTGRHELKGKTAWYTSPVGAHPSLAEIIVQRAREAGATGGEALVVLGHGTPRNPNSEKNIYLQTERVAGMDFFREVVTAFLDQEPGLEQVWSLVEAKEIVVVPMFVADGWHVSETIPSDLDLTGGENIKGGRRLRFAAAVGTHERISDVVMTLAREATGNSSPVEWTDVESLEVEELKRVLAGGTTLFGELTISSRGSGVVIQGPFGEETDLAPTAPDEFRQWIRHDANETYRPLSGARSLKTGWVKEFDSAEKAAEWIDLIYPASLRHAALQHQERLTLVDGPAALDRQTGRYADAGGMSEARIRRCSAALCSDCVRSPVWLDNTGNSLIPCPEPCSVFASLAREAAGWGTGETQEERDALPPGFADFQNPANLTRKRYFSA